VRYEGQVKQRQQKELAESIMAKIESELQDPKNLKNILDQSVKDVERALRSLDIIRKHTDNLQASSPPSQHSLTKRRRMW